jgi:hypothetical protein
MAEILALSIPILLLLALILNSMARYQIERAKVLGSQEATATAELRKLVEELRETTAQYDLALDQTLQRIERRLGDLENRVAQLEQQQSQQVMR